MNNNNNNSDTTTTNNKNMNNNTVNDIHVMHFQIKVKIISDDKGRPRLFCSQQQHNCSLIRDLTNILSHEDSKELCLCGPLLSTGAPRVVQKLV